MTICFWEFFMNPPAKRIMAVTCALAASTLSSCNAASSLFTSSRNAKDGLLNPVLSLSCELPPKHVTHTSTEVL